MMRLFGDRLEEGIAHEISHLRQPKDQPSDKVNASERFNERQSFLRQSQPIPVNDGTFDSGSSAPKGGAKFGSSAQGPVTEQGSSILSQQLHISETVDEKKFRLFKWAYYERVALPLEQIKEKLLQNTNTIRFLSLFCNFTTIMLAWGDNSSLS